MELLQQIETWIQPALEQHKVELVSLEFRKEDGMKILQVAIMHEDGSMDLDTCADVSEAISTILDLHEDSIEGEYYLEVCSAGAERELKNDQQIRAALDKYVYVSFFEPIQQMEDVVGYLKGVEDDVITVQYMQKTAKRFISIPKSNIKKIRLSVKI
ncbi:MAG: ribosome maturation factor RimP [Erysipelotrichaceae bacterium]|nr:ribosome maturation factor RimP [Erysipelotrichaceae bacterium]